MYKSNFIFNLLALSAMPLLLLIFMIFILYKLLISKEKDYMRERFIERGLFKIKSILGIIVLFALSIYGAYSSIDQWKDLPYVLTEKYPTLEHKIEKEVYISGRNSHELILINGTWYSFYGSKIPSAGVSVSIKYLPNTKEIYEISW